MFLMIIILIPFISSGESESLELICISQILQPFDLQQKKWTWTFWRVAGLLRVTWSYNKMLGYTVLHSKYAKSWKSYLYWYYTYVLDPAETLDKPVDHEV